MPVCVLYPVHVCVLSLFSLSLLIITGLRACISLSAGQPCHISSKQGSSLQKALDNSPKPWPLKQKPVLHPFTFSFVFLSLFLSFLFFLLSLLLPPILKPPPPPFLSFHLCLSCLFKVFSPLPALLRSVRWGGGVPLTRKIYMLSHPTPLKLEPILTLF